MLATPTQAPRAFTSAPIIESVFAKVATGGTVEKPHCEIVRVLVERGHSQHLQQWWQVRSANGKEWFCPREDMIKLFPIFKAVYYGA